MQCTRFDYGDKNSVRSLRGTAPFQTVYLKMCWSYVLLTRFVLDHFSHIMVPQDRFNGFKTQHVNGQANQ